MRIEDRVASDVRAGPVQTAKGRHHFGVGICVEIAELNAGVADRLGKVNNEDHVAVVAIVNGTIVSPRCGPSGPSTEINVPSVAEMLIVISPCVDVIVEKLPCVSSSKLNKTALPAIGNASMTPKTTNDTTLRVSVSLIISFRNSFDLNVIISDTPCHGGIGRRRSDTQTACHIWHAPNHIEFASFLRAK